MDKLQPIIRHHFWILAGITIPLILYGYYSSNSALSAATAEREKALTDVKSSVSTGNEPNEDYIKKLDRINTFLDESVQDAIVDLWRKQQERMTWPQAVAGRIPDEFLAPFDQQVPFIYKGLYPELIRKLQARAQPVEPVLTEAGALGGPMGGPMDRSGRVVPIKPPATKSNQKLILAATVPHAEFGQFGITSQEMWDAQIDIWLTEILIDAIVKMNADKESISEAVIRRVDVIELVGGSGEPVTKDSNAQGGDMGGMGGMPGMGMPMAGMNAASAPTEIGFSPEEEFGLALEGGADGGMGMGMPMGMDGAGGATVTPPKRYVGEKEDAPFVERGFYLSVIIQQTKIADFIVALANSDWPVQIRRFQVGANPYAVETPLTGQPGFGSEGMMGGMPMMNNRPTATMEGVGRRSGSSRRSGMTMPGMDGRRGGSEIINHYQGTLPEFALASLNHPDLVQLDLCGVITMYRQPKEALAALEARKAAEAAANAPAAETVPGETPLDMEEPGEAMPADDTAPAADPTAPSEPTDDTAAMPDPESAPPTPADGASESTESAPPAPEAETPANDPAN